MTEVKTQEQKKCYSCREPVAIGVVVCKDCRSKPIKSSATLVIYNKI